MSSDNDRLITITDPDQDRYARLRLMQNYRQDVIEQARVMVVGAGALGNEVLKNLALLGVGYIYLVDFDTIEISNLTRSILFRQGDTGRAKAEVAAERVRQINPDVHILPVKGDIAYDVGAGIFRQMDVVLGCLDNRSARMALNRACWRVRRPWIDGALDVADGSLRVFSPPQGACYECLMTKQDYALINLRYSCPPGTIREGVAITTPMSASIIGAMQVQETVKLLHGLPVLASAGVIYSAETMRTTPISYSRRDDCPAHDLAEPLMGLPYGVNDLTVGRLVELAQEQAGDRSLVILPDKVVTYFYCTHCDRLDKNYRPYRLVVPPALNCPVCQQARTYDLATVLASSEATRDLPLAQVGFPPLDIVTVRGSRQQVYVELSGDRERTLPGW
jgi:adenylyltransferase/sulfurtransferase